MIYIKNKKNCCGCHACYNACPVNAIKMINDERGFKYPQIDEQKCIHCGLCEKVCPILNCKEFSDEPVAYACINNNLNVRLQSSSGGIFTLLATAIIEKQGVVFGAEFDDEFNVVHTYAEKIEEIDKYRGAKYVQSDIKDTYKVAKKLLEQGRYVLFTGTPCQIEGLVTFLGKDYPKLYLQDIICHGVPSPKIWETYKKYRETEANSKLTKTSFRSKCGATWARYHVNMVFEDNSKYDKLHSEDSYMKAFLRHLSLRESCTSCKFKNRNRASDITLADFWGIGKVKPELDDEKGISLVIVNSKKGQELFNEVKSSMLFKEVKFEEAVKNNPSYFKSSEPIKSQSKFFENIDRLDFEINVKKSIPKDYIKKAKTKLKNFIKKILNLVMKKRKV